MKRWWKAALLFLLWAAAFAVCMWGGGRSAWFLFYALGGLNAYVWLVYALSPSTIAVTRRLDRDRYTAGESVEVSVWLRLDSRIAVSWIAVSESWRRQGKPFREFRKLLFPTGKAKALRYEYRLQHVPRGRYSSPEMVIVTGDVFSILTKEHRVQAECGFLAVPMPAPVLGRMRFSGGQQEGRFRPLLPWNESTATHGVREYVPGDALSRIDWKASARGGEWRTKVLEETGDGRLLIALDAHHTDELQLERAIRICAGIMRWVKESGGRFGWASSASAAVESLSHDLSFEIGLELLSEVELVPERKKSRHDWLSSAYRQAPGRTALVYVGSALDDSTVETLASLRERGVAVHVVRVGEDAAEPLRERHRWAAINGMGCALSVVRKEDLA